MNYKDRFTNKIVQTKEFNHEPGMISYINDNIDAIEIVQIYVSQKKKFELGNYEYTNNFHLMYKIKEKQMI